MEVLGSLLALYKVPEFFSVVHFDFATWVIEPHYFGAFLTAVFG